MTSIDDEGWSIVDSKGSVTSPRVLSTPRTPSKEDLGDNQDQTSTVVTIQDVLRNLAEMQRAGKTLYGAQRTAFNRHVSEFAEAAAHHSFAALERAKVEAQRVLTSFQAAASASGVFGDGPSAQLPVSGLITSYPYEDEDNRDIEAYLTKCLITQLAKDNIVPFDGNSMRFGEWIASVRPYMSAILPGEDGTVLNYLHAIRLYSQPESAVVIEGVLPILAERESWHEAEQLLDDLFLRRQARLEVYEKHLYVFSNN